jgi:hypothetical protein
MLEDQMAAIIILQTRPANPPVKAEGTQTAEKPKSPVTPPPKSPVTPRPKSPVTPPPRSPTPTIISKIKPQTEVYAVWFDDDGFVYKVCLKHSKTNLGIGVNDQQRSLKKWVTSD